jgi:hypothetical protein
MRLQERYLVQANLGGYATLTKIRWTAISPSNTPLYAFAALDASLNEPMSQPQPWVHSRMKAAEHDRGYSCRIYDPSVMAT